MNVNKLLQSAHSAKSQRTNETLGRHIWRNKEFYLMLLPGVLYFLLFKITPLFGSVIAFQDYRYYKGILNSEWVGLRNFTYIFTLPGFWTAFRNTLILNLYSLVLGFPAPIILALLLNEMRGRFFKRFTQTIIYMPHFFSWVIVGGLFISLLSPGYGAVNLVLQKFGHESIYFTADPNYIRAIIVGTGIWKGAGWGTIVYLATLTGLDPALYDAAQVDGANRWKQLIHITIPTMMPTIVMMLILKIGDLLESGFEHVYVFLNTAVLDKADTIETFVYRNGIVGGQYSLATAVGLFQMVLAILLVMFANSVAKRFSDYSLY